MNNQAILAWLFHPENVELIYQTLGISDLYIPGEDQRNKQLYEISEMLTSMPMETGQVDPNTGQPAAMSSVQIEEIDDDAIHMEVLKAFMNSPVGIDLKQSNPPAYMNIMLHYQMHSQRLMLMQQQQAEMEAANNQPPPDEGSSDQNTSEPVQ